MRRLYETFLRFAPDQAGWDYWVGELKGQGRNGVLEAFLDAGAYREQADALYREIFWLIGDQLGTTRMIAERTGALAGLKRHDYLPFGEEIAANIGARNVPHNAFGYVDDSNRMQFTGHERDEETGLDYMQARHFSSAQGRFISVDTVGGRGTDPQTLNLYAYVNNNPLRYTDPTGHEKQKEQPGDHPSEPAPTFFHSGLEIIAAAEGEFDRLAVDVLENSRIKSALKDDSDNSPSSESTDSSRTSESSGGDVTVSAAITGIARPAANDGVNIAIEYSIEERTLWLWSVNAAGEYQELLFSTYAESGSPRVSIEYPHGISKPCLNNVDCVREKNAGPLPPGFYSLNVKDLVERGRMRAVGSWLKGNGDWGSFYVPLTPQESTPTYGRNNFYLHGGFFSGSAGCIDVGGGFGGDKSTRTLIKLLRSDKDGVVPVTIIISSPKK